MNPTAAKTKAKILDKMDFGEKMLAGFREAAAYAAGEPNECEVEEYEPRVHALTGEYIQEIRHKVARSTIEADPQRALMLVSKL